MSELPNKWIRTDLGTIATWGSGGTPSRTNPTYYGGTIPWIKTGELGKGPITDTEEKITELGLRNSSAKIFKKGSVAIALYGATIGKTSILGIDAATNQACAVGFPLDGVITSEYLLYYLMSQKEAFVDSGQGGAQPNISQTIIKNWPIPLAPLPEQKRIADKLDVLLERVDMCQAHLGRVPEILKRFRQSVLAVATSGRLTEGWRGERGISQSWRFVTLREVATGFNYGTSAKSQKSGSVPVLRMGNIQDGKLDWEDLVYTSDNEEIQKYRIISGDVLFNRTNSPELVGKTAVYKGEHPAIFAGYLIRVRCGDDLLPDFLNYCLNSPQGRDWAWQVKSDGVSQSNINAQKLADFEINLPPVPEQHEIVRRVERLFAFADRLEARWREAQARVGQLTPSLLAKAFRGELVAQREGEEEVGRLVEMVREGRR